MGAVNGGAFDLTYTYPNGEARFATFTPFFIGYLALAADNTTFSTHVSVHLFDELAAGTYGPDNFDTAGGSQQFRRASPALWSTSGRGSSTR